MGSDPYPNNIWQNAVYPSSYCDNGTAGTFRIDSPTCNWFNAPLVPAAQFNATS